MHKNNDTPSQARIDANRRNARKSIGPRTAAGKAASSRNRIVHGLRANKTILVAGDDPEEFRALLADLESRFQPVGEGEERLVLRIAADQWRLDRTLPMEAGIYRARLNGVDAADYARRRELRNHRENHKLNPEFVPPAPPPPDPDDCLTRAFLSDCGRRHELGMLARYESGLERSIDRCLRQLEKFQSARRAASAQMPLPVPPADSPTPDAGAPGVTASNDVNCHSNPTPATVPPAEIPRAFLRMYALLHALLACALSAPHRHPHRPPTSPRTTASRFQSVAFSPSPITM